MAPMEKMIELAQTYKEAPTGGEKAMEALRALCNQVEAMVMLAASERKEPYPTDPQAQRMREFFNTCRGG